jgi:hypothetical protein
MVKNMLGNRTPTQFVELRPAERLIVYRRHLVSPRVLTATVRYTLNDSHGLRALIRLLDDSHGVRPLTRLQKGDQEMASQKIMREAKKVFYSENKFDMSSAYLKQFFKDDSTALVRFIVVTVHLEDDDKISKPEENRPCGLERLIWLENPEMIKVVIPSKGIDDDRTQSKLKEIAKVIKQLLTEFSGCFQICLTNLEQPLLSYDLTPYWEDPAREPTNDEVDKFRGILESTVTEDWMQKQVIAWIQEDTRKDPRI